ncbi:MAG: lipid-binding SYLF domain-containing protein [Desulfatibacillaceae bacterium]
MKRTLVAVLCAIALAMFPSCQQKVIESTPPGAVEDPDREYVSPGHEQPLAHVSISPPPQKEYPKPPDEDSPEQLLVEKAALVVRDMKAAPEFEAFSILLKEARGILIFPKLVKAALIHVGGEGGNGVMTLRQADGGWSAPAFYTLAEATVGFELGYQEASYVVLFMNEQAAYKAMGGSFTLGAGVGATAITAGKATELSIAGNFRDVYYFANERGLYAGAAIEGGGVQARKDMNEAYYGESVSPHDILRAGKFGNHPGQALLTDVLGSRK